MRGVLITLEGCDGCGKSTQAALPLRAPGRLRPAGRAGGRAGRRRPRARRPRRPARPSASVLLHGPSSLAPWTETLLYAAARAELVETVLLPELEAGRVLVLDRFVDSSLAYQGFARELGVDEVLAVNEPALQRRAARRHAGPRRRPRRGAGRSGAGDGRADRIEAEGLEFQQRVAAGFAALARRFPERVRLIDGFRDVELVAADVEAAALEAVADAGLRLGG